MTAHRTSYRQWASPDGFAAGSATGVLVDDALVISTPTSAREYVDPYGDGSMVTYDESTWTSPAVTAEVPATELVASWNAQTPAGTWIEVAVDIRVVGQTDWSSHLLGRWAESDADIHRATDGDRETGSLHVEFDVVRAKPGFALAEWRLSVALLRRAGCTVTPRVSLLGAMTSGPAPVASDLGTAVDCSMATTGGSARGMSLAVPAYSQQLHRGEYAELNGGGEAWCSPTSTAMVMGTWGRGPSPAEYAWVNDSCPAPWIAHAAARTFDQAYQGAGNWSFNTAYAASFGLVAFVTRLRSLHEAEAFVAAGIPLVASVSFTRAELAGAGYDTEGHLLVIVGFTETGDVVVNDPASHGLPSDDEVQTVYDRVQFERVWLPTSGGLVYVIRPADVALPPRPEGLPAAW